jgi:DNA-binding CsgD family transcriptional regulator
MGKSKGSGPRDGNPSRAADMTAIVRLVSNLPVDGNAQARDRRRLLAELCKVIGEHVSRSTGAGVGPGMGLSRRARQTLEHLLQGDSEKQIARRLELSPHTVHVYVKQIYLRFGVSSRGELLARFVRGA